jgi:protein TonB
MPFSASFAAILLAAQSAAPAAIGPSIQVYGTGQAVPPGLSTYFRAGDYPADALSAHEEGSVRIHVVTGSDGAVSDCSVTLSSGHPSLDAATCAIARARFRFVPARDELDLPVGNTQDFIVAWRLPGA